MECSSGAMRLSEVPASGRMPHRLEKAGTLRPALDWHVSPPRSNGLIGAGRWSTQPEWNRQTSRAPVAATRAGGRFSASASECSSRSRPRRALRRLRLLRSASQIASSRVPYATWCPPARAPSSPHCTGRKTRPVLASRPSTVRVCSSNSLRAVVEQVTRLDGGRTALT